MFWRTPQSGTPVFIYAVDKQGRLVTGRWPDDPNDNVIVHALDRDVYSTFEYDRQVRENPEIANWGFSDKTATFQWEESMYIEYDGQTYEIPESEDSITPDLPDYQP